MTLHAWANALTVSASSVNSTRSEPSGSNAAFAPHARRSILLVRTRGDDAVMQRVRAELLAHGWRIIELQLDRSTMGQGELGRLAAEQVATAAVRIDAAMGQIDIHIARSWGNIDETLQSEGEAIDDQVLAFRTTEALRAHGLVESSTAEPSSNDAVQPIADIPKPPGDGGTSPATKSAVGSTRAMDIEAAQSRRAPIRVTRAVATQQLWLELAPAFAASPGGLGANVMGWAGVRYAFLPSVSAMAFGAMPMHSHEVVESEGRATVSTYLLGGSFELEWVRRAYGSAAAGIGATLLLTDMLGAPQAGYRGTSDRVTSAGPHVYARLDLALAPRWRIFATPLVGMSIPEVRVAFEQRVVRSWGQPWALLALGVEFCAAGR